MQSIEEWTTILDGGCGMDIIYLDFQKAFDSLLHKRLVRKLCGYMIDGNILAWISDFLNNQKQHFSEQELVRLGRSNKWCSAGICLRPHSIYPLSQ